MRGVRPPARLKIASCAVVGITQNGGLKFPLCCPPDLTSKSAELGRATAPVIHLIFRVCLRTISCGCNKSALFLPCFSGVGAQRSDQLAKAALGKFDRA